MLPATRHRLLPGLRRLLRSVTIAGLALGFSNEAATAADITNGAPSGQLLPIRVQSEGHYLETTDGSCKSSAP